MIRLFHVSDNPGIEIFYPRPSPSPHVQGDLIWAVDEEHLVNYLLPRECPRVCYRSKSEQVVAVEQRWEEKIEAAELTLYEFSPGPFRLSDQNAGYYVSSEAVKSIRRELLGNLPEEIGKRGAELRILPELFSFRDEVTSAQKEFSVIRFRNAKHAAKPYVSPKAES